MTATACDAVARLTEAWPAANNDATTTQDDTGFGELMRYRAELRSHCFRMLRSTDEAEDAVQEALFHAWRARASFAGRAPVRSWLYRIATNVCLDEIQYRHRRARRIPRSDWLAPVAHSRDDQLEAAAPSHAQPESLVVAKELLTHACFTVIAVLTPRQRAVLILRDVLCWPASGTAQHLDTSVAAVHSALQRARAALAEARSTAVDGRHPASAMSGERRALLDRYVHALGRPDVAALVELVRADDAVAAAA
jgi:RNA polymerase sigma-70 factor (ECF subfamily)